MPADSARGPLALGPLASRYGLLGLGLLLIIVFSLLLPSTFPTSTTALSILDAQAVIAMLALAEMIVVIVGEFDLSVGYLTGLTHILALGLIIKSGMPWPLAVALVIAIGMAVGLVNGVLVHILQIDSFIATLGVGTIAYAVSNWYTAQQQVTGALPAGFAGIYDTKVLGVPASAFYVVVMLLALWLLLEFTPTGRYLYALGSNRRAAELTGIHSRRYVIGAFMASGGIVAIAGVVLASRLQIGDVGNGPDFLLPTFVGAMLGSTTIKPGRANPLGTLVAVLVLGVGIAGFQQLGATYYITPLFNGVTLVAGVGLAGYASRRVRRVRDRPASVDP
jgi:ribose transport system permease protein